MKITVRVPASTANIGTGVDCLGIALNKYLNVTFETNSELEVVFKSGFEHDIPIEKNLVVDGAKSVFSKANSQFPTMKITMETEIPSCRGLGSSATAIVAGVFGANAWLDNPFSVNELINIATEIEGHPDNIVPCAVGGFNVSMSQGRNVFYHKLELDKSLKFITAVPDYELSTKLARSVVPKEFPLSAVVSQIQRACYLVAGISSNNFNAFNYATEDVVFTPARKSLIPGYENVSLSAMRNGAICSMISGAGPTIIAFAKENITAISDAMQNGFSQADITSVVHVLETDNIGAVVSKL